MVEFVAFDSAWVATSATGRSGAPLMFTSGTSYGEAVGSYLGEPLYHGSLDSAEYERRLLRNGLCILDYRAGSQFANARASKRLKPA